MIYFNPTTQDIAYRNAYAASTSMFIRCCYNLRLINQNYFVFNF